LASTSSTTRTRPISAAIGSLPQFRTTFEEMIGPGTEDSHTRASRRRRKGSCLEAASSPLSIMYG
jgi:hypothetical protein